MKLTCQTNTKSPNAPVHRHQKRRFGHPVVIAANSRDQPVQQPLQPQSPVRQRLQREPVPRELLPVVGHYGPAEHPRSARRQHERAEQEKHARMYAAIPSRFFSRTRFHRFIPASHDSPRN